ncbi:MAG: glycosyltransferase [Nanoarchaeota archaeon]
MKVSVIVVTLNEEQNIHACLDALVKQDVPKEDYEVLVVDGASKDKTQEIVQSFAKEHHTVRLIVEKNGSIARCRNIGIQQSTYDHIAFTDADCVVPADWLRRLKRGYARHTVGIKNLAGVGGANIPPENGSSFQQAIGIAFNSFFGSLGSIQAQPVKHNKELFSISCSNSLYQKKALLDVDMFSEELENQGEDWDMGAKLQKKGYVVYGIHDCAVWHNFRATPFLFWKNMVFYGDGRMRLMKKHPDIIKGKYLIPLFFIPLFVLSAAAFFFTKNPYVLVPFLYFPLLLLYSLSLAGQAKKAELGLEVFLVFLLQHFGYSWGEVKGLRWFVN